MSGELKEYWHGLYTGEQVRRIVPDIERLPTRTLDARVVRPVGEPSTKVEKTAFKSTQGRCLYRVSLWRSEAQASDFERTGRLCRKIDVYRKGTRGKPATYLHSTNWHRTCRDAVRAASQAHGIDAGELYGRFSK